MTELAFLLAAGSAIVGIVWLVMSCALNDATLFKHGMCAFFGTGVCAGVSLIMTCLKQA
jgi:hypothetical protein